MSHTNRESKQDARRAHRAERNAKRQGAGTWNGSGERIARRANGRPQS